jgi:predicted NBD/HSP70 family sugar kinase
MTKGSAILRQHNIRRVLHYLRTHDTTSRLDLAQSLGVSKNTISIIIEKMIKEGIVREMGTEESVEAGRPKIVLSLRPDSYKAIGILLKRNHLEWMVTDYRSNILEQDAISFNTLDIDACLANLTGLCKRLLGRHPETIGIGIAVSGIVNHETGELCYSAPLGWEQVAIRERIAKKVEVPLLVLNKVKAAAVLPIQGIENHSLAKFYVSIRDSVGGALMIGTELYHGDSWTAGEIGHMVMDPEGPKCSCGQHGCLETLINTAAVEKAYESDKDSYRKAGTYLGIALSQVVHLFNPSYIIIDSPYDQNEAFRTGIEKMIQKRSMSYPLQKPQLVFIQTSHAEAMGASVAVIQAFEKEYML